MPKKNRDRGKGATPPGGTESGVGQSASDSGQGGDATVRVQVPPGGYDHEAVEGQSLVNTAAARAAANSVSHDDDGGTAGEATEDSTPPVMWVNPNKRRGSEEHDPVAAGTGDQPVPDIMDASELGVVLLGTADHDPVPAEDENFVEVAEDEEEDADAPTMALDVAAIAAAAAAAGHDPEQTWGEAGGSAAEPVEEPEEDADAPTMALDVSAIAAAAAAAGHDTGDWGDTVADDRGAPSDEYTGDEGWDDAEGGEEDHDAPTMALDVSAIGAPAAAAGHDTGDWDTEAEDLPTRALDVSAAEEAGAEAAAEQATVMLEVGAGADAGAEATVMLDTSDGAGSEATTLLDVSDAGDAASFEEAFETVMLQTPERSGEHEPAETVMLETHEARLSSEYEPVEGAVKMGAAAKEDKGLFDDPYHMPDVGDDEELDFTADPRMPEIGETMGDRYKLLRLLGQGGFAVVFEAEDLAIGGNVAVKCLQAEKSVDPEFAQRFKDEVKVVRHLQHPNTIKITDTGETDRQCLYMVMEFVDGKPLDEYITEHGALDPSRTVHIGKQILRSLAEAHDKGIIHRDLKPPNVMLTQMGGETDYVKVLDFGIAKALEADLTQAQTKTGIVFCTPKYAPPEILTGRKVSAAADVYACGLMMAELLSGAPIIAAPSDAEAIAYQLSPEPPPIPPEVLNTPLGAVLQRACDKDVDKRYQNAGEMLDALNKIGQEHLPTVPLLITSVNPLKTGQVAFDSTIQFPGAGGGADATMRVGQQTTVLTERKTPWGAVVGGMLALAAAVALIVIVTQQSGGDEELGSVTPTPGQTDLGSVGDEDVGQGQVSGPSAREILSARLAASDWQAGSWLGAEEESSAASTGTRPDAGPTTVAEGTGESGPIAVVSLVEGSGEGTGSNPAILVIDEEIAAREAEETAKLEAERLAALYESAQAANNAMTLLQNALVEGDIPEADRASATSQLILLTENMVEILTELDRCDAAERRMDRALADIEVPLEDTVSVQLMSDRVEDCRTRVAEQRPEWDPRVYQARLRDGNRFFEDASLVEDDDVEAKRTLLYRSLHARQEAIDLLETALSNGDIPDEPVNAEGRTPRDGASRDLALLNQQVLATMYELDLAVAVEVQTEEIQTQAAIMSEEAQAELVSITEVIEEEKKEEEELAAAERQQIRAEAVAAREGTGQQAEGSGTQVATAGTGGGTGQVAAAPVPALWDPTAFADLVAEANEEYERAQDTTIELETALERASLRCTYDADCNEGFVCIGGSCTEPLVPEGPPTYTVIVRLDSDEPSRVRVYQGGELLGRTPFEHTFTTVEESITLTLRKRDYESSDIEISTTEAPEYTAEVNLELRNVFGRTQTLSERLRDHRRQEKTQTQADLACHSDLDCAEDSACRQSTCTVLPNPTDKPDEDGR